MRASRVIFVWQKTEIRAGPPSPPGIRWVGGEGYFASMKAGLFCVCESKLSHRSPIFFFRPTGGQLRVTRHAHVSLHNAATTIQVFDRHCLSPVARHGAGRNVRFK